MAATDTVKQAAQEWKRRHKSEVPNGLFGAPIEYLAERCPQAVIEVLWDYVVKLEKVNAEHHEQSLTLFRSLM